MSESAPAAMPPDSPASRGGGGSVVWSVISITLKIGAVLAILAVVGFLFLVWWLGQAYPAPKGVAAPVEWASQTVVLGPDRRIVSGLLTIEVPVFPPEARVGVSVGAPSIPAGSAAPGELLAGPAVRLSMTSAGSTTGCVAPCALHVAQPPECSAGGCRIATSLTLELDGDAAAMAGPVTLQVAGGLSMPIDEPLPEGLAVDLALEGATAPGAG